MTERFDYRSDSEDHMEASVPRSMQHLFLLRRLKVPCLDNTFLLPGSSMQPASDRLYLRHAKGDPRIYFRRGEF